MFDKKWEEVHAEREWGRYPKEELVRWVASNYYNVEDRSALRFLDLGCGGGASTWFLAREGFTVTALDGSQNAMKRLGEKPYMRLLQATGVVADAIRLPFKDNSFDAVIDIVCVAHNDKYDIDSIVKEITRVLKPGGRVFSVLPDGGSPEMYKQYGTVTFFEMFGAMTLYPQSRFEDIRVDWTVTCEDGRYIKTWFVKARLKETTNVNG